MQKILDNIKLAIIYLGILLIIDFITTKIEREILFGYTFQAIIFIFFITSLFINRELLNMIDNIYLRYFLMVLLCGILTILFGLIAITVAVNFHFAIGGKL